MPADAQKVNYRRLGFLSKFLELQQVMWTTNAGLTDRHTFDSRPSSWPLLRRGIVSWMYYSLIKSDGLFLEFLGQGPSSNIPHWQPYDMVHHHNVHRYLCRGPGIVDPARQERIQRFR